MKLEQLLSKLWQQYVHESPQALEIYNLFIKQGEQVINDHIAFRTFDDPRVNVERLGKFFEALGYEAKGEYQFPVKKLYARHYEHKHDDKQPKIFISELKTKEFSAFLQQQAKACVDAIDVQLLQSPELLYAGSLWQPLDYEVYQKLLSESEYAAWFYVFGFRANHFTIFINYLKKYTSIEAVNALLKQHGYELNAAGGEVKGKPEELLVQSSTIANKVSIAFKQGQYEVLNSYYEFAKRYAKADGQLYQGFLAANADKIFESTNVKRG
jgi:hypothetical protein